MPSPHHPDLQHDADGPTLISYLEWLRRRWWILALAAVLGIGSGLLVTRLQTPTYTSTTSVLVRQVGPDAQPGTKVNLDTEAQVVRSLVVAERARTLLKTGTSAEDLVQSLTVTVPPNSQVLQIAYESITPESAQNASHSFAQAYLDLRLATATKAVENETTAINQQIAEVKKQLAAAAGKIAAAPANSAARAQAQADQDVLTNQLAKLNERLSPLQATTPDPGQIISDAALPRKPSSPNRTLNLASGMGAGLLFGIVLALLLDRLDTRVRRGRDVTARTGLPTLLELPVRVPSLAVLAPTHRVSRELGRLRNVLLSIMPEPGPGRGRQLLLTDTSPGPAAGFVAANLAAAYARTGAQVAVVTTRADSPLTAMFGGAKPGHTLAEVLRHDVGALAALTPAPGLSTLRVLFPGNLDTEVELPVARMREILRELAARFDHVLIETARPTQAVEAQALARHVDGVILVIESGQSRSSEITAALHQFEQVDAPVLGSVLAPRLPGSSKGTGAAGAKPDGKSPSPRPRPEPVFPAATESSDNTIILPRPTNRPVGAVTPPKPAPTATAAKPVPAAPLNAAGSARQSTVYRSNRDSDRIDGTNRRSMAFDPVEEQE
ncbi:Capsular polysaccharide biosynthesis protein [Micromonospora rhizosphaerae]|uniref:Capsular polysaccharide biosynthesis protein n=1 Tax=Micromonospora rhizosphaerae TaxID=568872 RepID=A0A1C6RE56_9ACTN|nr:Wzz/FepE/Etk N-terminal domain-containing protein [Micromonospora rhizosphaerae]SCL15430.1 Capsular polysaccharide biosynthesis protein [Micromonospora rhizosphaerae]